MQEFEGMGAMLELDRYSLQLWRTSLLTQYQACGDVSEVKLANVNTSANARTKSTFLLYM